MRISSISHRYGCILEGFSALRTSLKQSWRAARDVASLEVFTDRHLIDIGLWRECGPAHRRHLMRF